ncbi:hypothetical protein PFISCL1PPCAC_11797, partial [Pristionchus fissidentatus]
FSVLYFLFDTDEFVVEYMEPILRDHAIGTRMPLEDYSATVFWNGAFVGPRWKPISGIGVMAVRLRTFLKLISRIPIS